jgi:hypothetical protein
MTLRHHDQLVFHQKREQELLDALKEVADTLDETLGMVDELTGKNPQYVPQRIRNVAARYTTKNAPPSAFSASTGTAPSSTHHNAVPAGLAPLPLGAPTMMPPLMMPNKHGHPVGPHGVPYPMSAYPGAFGMHHQLPAPLPFPFPLSSLPGYSGHF